ncbi:MAG: STAS domain-containing protein [Oscillospiraceae bacterium]|nr:STAS domain-containing protein [Oscillospiraceae bacterium]
MIITTQKNGKTLLVIPEGRIDTQTAPEFEQKLSEELGDATELQIDLGQVNYISSAGLRVLLAYTQEMDERGGTIKAINVNDIVRKIFDLTGFLDIQGIE